MIFLKTRLITCHEVLALVIFLKKNAHVRSLFVFFRNFSYSSIIIIADRRSSLDDCEKRSSGLGEPRATSVDLHNSARVFKPSPSDSRDIGGILQCEAAPLATRNCRMIMSANRLVLPNFPELGVKATKFGPKP